MSEASDLPDQEPGSEHPRAVFDLFGHAAEDRAMARAIGQGKLHHAWLVTGPKGVGKATLAYRFARRLLGASGPADTLACSPEDPVSRKIAQGAHPDLRVANRWDPEEHKVRKEIVVDAVRALTRFFEMKADGPTGRRVGIVDCADDLNTNAANALLKTLEEPPPGAVLILIAHAPGGLLPTIRSRCRRLALRPVPQDMVRAAAPDADEASVLLAGGSPGRARALAALGAGKLYAGLSAHLSGLPRAPLAEALALADAAADANRFAALFDLLQDWLARAGRAGAGMPVEEIEPGESAALARLARSAPAGAVAQAWSEVGRLRHAALSLNLDRGLATLDALRSVRAALAGGQGATL